MTDDTLRYISDAFGEANTLNERAVPLGYAVLTEAGGPLGGDGSQTRTSSYSVRPFGFEDGRQDRRFDDLDAVREHLDYLETLPGWRLDLDDDSIEVDGVKLTVTDKASGETIYLGGGWRWMISGGREAGEPLGAGLTHLSVRADTPPPFGRWHKVVA